MSPVSPYWSNSEYWPQKWSQSGNIHSIIVDVHVSWQSALLLLCIHLSLVCYNKDLVCLFLLLEVLQCSAPFSRTDTFFFPLSLGQLNTTPHSWKPLAVTQVLFYQTACQMMSCWCLIAWPVSTKNNCVLL